jgi:hypothetical protein
MPTILIKIDRPSTGQNQIRTRLIIPLHSREFGGVVESQGNACPRAPSPAILFPSHAGRIGQKSDFPIRIEVFGVIGGQNADRRLERMLCL